MNQKVHEDLCNVIDPELDINIVDWGLYGIDLDEDFSVAMTLTTPGCPLHDSTTNGVKQRISKIEEVNGVDVNLVWEPRWEPTNMITRAKSMLAQR